MKAYVVYWPNECDAEGGVWFADTASKARYRAYLVARDIGYDVRLPDFTVRRAPQYDSLVGRAGGYSRQTADRMLGR